jgi:hypothetical protein
MLRGKQASRSERLWLEAEDDWRRPPRPAKGARRPRRRDRLSPDARYVVDLADELIGEAGWREHRFRWLTEDGTDGATPLPVDAYYPGPGLVVQYRERRERGDEERERLIPAHGLALVTVRLETLATNGRGRVARRPDLDRDALAELLHSVRAPRRVAALRRARYGGPATRAWQLHIAGLALGLLAAGVLLLAQPVGNSQFWLNVGGALAAFGLAYDLYARVLGVAAARAAGERGWTWACALGGSPVVVLHAARQRSGPSGPELDTLAGLLLLTVVLALLVASLTGLGGSG